MFTALLVIIYVSFISLGLPDSLLGSAWPAIQKSLEAPLPFAGVISMIVSCASMWIFRVTLCIVLCRFLGFGPMGVWIGMFTDWTVRGIAFLLRFRSRRWLEHQVI